MGTCRSPFLVLIDAHLNVVYSVVDDQNLFLQILLQPPQLIQ